MAKIALLGAAGKMGTRISRSLADEPPYEVLCVEGNAEGEQKLQARGDRAWTLPDAVAQADIVIMAAPDRIFGTVAAQVVPRMKPQALLVCLDPAGPHAGLIPPREDISVFVCHPAHPSIFNEETDLAARFDFFGSGKARQPIVCALMRGPEEDYAKGEQLATAMWKPVIRAHRVTVEQMAMLEPAMSETVGATCAAVMREAMEEAIARGVPAEAARDFMLGHVFCALGIVFDRAGFTFSDGAKKAIAEAKKDIFQPDWKKVFEPEVLRRSCAKITGQEP
jgi:D-apionate oxidoisomerase